MSMGGGADFNHHIAEAVVTLRWKDDEYYRGLDKAKARLDAFIESAGTAGLSAHGTVNDVTNSTARFFQGVREAKRSIGTLVSAINSAGQRMNDLLSPVAGMFSGMVGSVGSLNEKLEIAKKNTKDLTAAVRDLKSAMDGAGEWSPGKKKGGAGGGGGGGKGGGSGPNWQWGPGSHTAYSSTAIVPWNVSRGGTFGRSLTYSGGTLARFGSLGRGWSFGEGGGVGMGGPQPVREWQKPAPLQLPAPAGHQGWGQWFGNAVKSLGVTVEDFNRGLKLAKRLSESGRDAFGFSAGSRDLAPVNFSRGMGRTVRLLGGAAGRGLSSAIRPIRKKAGEKIRESYDGGTLGDISDWAGDVSERAGKEMDRIAKKARKGMDSIVRDVKKQWDQIKPELDKAKEQMSQFLSPVAKAFDKISHSVGKLNRKLKEVRDSGPLAGIAGNLRPRNIGRGLGLLAGLSVRSAGKGIGAAAGAIKGSYNEGVLGKVAGAAKGIMFGAVKGVAGGVLGVVGSVAGGVVGMVKSGLTTIASTIGNLILTPVRMATGLVKGLFYASGISGVLAAVGGIKTAVHSENVGALLQRITGGSAKDTEGLMRSLRGSAQKTPGVALERYYEVAETGARMGLPIEQLKAFSDGMTKVGIVLDETELPLKEAANRIGSLISVFRGSSEDAAKYGSALVKLDQMSTASAREILDVANRFSGSAATFNMKPHETLALAAALRQARVPTETAGTAPGQILMRMASKRDMGEFAKVAGMDKGAFKELLEGNAYQAIKKVVGGLVEIENNLGAVEASRAMDKLHLDGQRVRSAMLQLGQVVGLMDSYLEASGNEWGNQAEIQRGVEISSRTLSAQFELLATEFKSIAIEAGRGFMPMLKGMVIGFRNLSERIRGFIEENGPTLDEWGKRVQTVFEAIGTVWEKWPSFLELAQVTLEEKLELARLTVEEKLLKVKDLFDDLKDYAVKRMGEAAASIKEMINPANLVAAAGGAIKRSAWRFGEKAMNWALGGRWESVMDPSPPNAKPGFFGRTFGTSDEDRRNRLAEIERQKEEVRRKGEERRAKPLGEVGNGIGENRFKDWVNTHQPQIKSMKDIVAGVKRDPNAVVKIIGDEARARLGNLGRTIASPLAPVVGGFKKPTTRDRMFLPGKDVVGPTKTDMLLARAKQADEKRREAIEEKREAAVRDAKIRANGGETKRIPQPGDDMPRREGFGMPEFVGGKDAGKHPLPKRLRSQGRGADTFAGRQWEQNRARRMSFNASFSRQRDAFNARARAYSSMSVADYLEGKRPMMDDGRRQVAEDPNVKATKEGNKTLEEILKEIKNAGLPSGGNGEKPAVPGGVFS